MVGSDRGWSNLEGTQLAKGTATALLPQMPQAESSASTAEVMIFRETFRLFHDTSWLLYVTTYSLFHNTVRAKHSKHI